MALYELLLPRMGESVAEATIIKWLKKPGDDIDIDDAVVEIATDKVDSEVSSPVKGKLAKNLCKEDEVAQVGQVIAIIETDVNEDKIIEPLPATPPVTALPPEKIPVKEAFKDHGAADEAQDHIPGIAFLSPKKDTHAVENNQIRFYSPLVRSIAAQENINQQELDQIIGSGAEGRLTKDDLLNYLQNQKQQKENTKEAAPFAFDDSKKPETKATNGQELKTARPQPASSGDAIIEMDRMRKMIADHMVISKQTSPHVTSFIEADVTSLVQWRDKNKDVFLQREGEKLTFMPIFIEAVASALKAMPMVNVSVNGTQIIIKRNINIGMATALPNGNLIVPVIKNADSLNILGLTKAVNDLANRARNNKLQPEEVKDGTFTITNIGSFGNTMGTPIINQPQAAILAVGAIKKKPAVVETASGDMIAIRQLMYLSLSYDHRIIDGALGGMFLKKVADFLENWDVKRQV